MRAHAVLAFSIAFVGAGSAFAQSAGRVLAAAGEVSIVRDGKEIKVIPHTEVRSGDLLRTGAASNAQVRLDDNSLIALRQKTEFRLDEFKFAGKEDGSERGIFSLIKGGFRTVTGLIGRTNRDRYRVSTPTATVGIRGTHFNLVMCQADCGETKDGLYGGVLEGRIGVNNESNIENQFGAGEFFHVADIRSPAQRLIAPPDFLSDKLEGQSKSKKEEKVADAPKEQAPTDGGQGLGAPSDQPPPPPTENVAIVMDYRATEVLNQEGTPLVLNDVTNPTAPTYSLEPAFEPSTVSGAVLSYAIATPHAPGTSGYSSEVSSSWDALNMFDDQGYKRMESCSGSCYLDRSLASNAEVASIPGVMEWGKWVGGPMAAGGWGDGLVFGDNQGFNYVVGMPTLDMPTSGTVSFSLLGATTPTFSDGIGGGLGVGTVTSATATANFTSATLTANMSLVFTGDSGTSNYTLAMTSGTIGRGTAGVSGSGTMTYDSGVNVCMTSGCTARFSGFFAGTEAAYLGLAYDASAYSQTYFSIGGVVVMKR